MSWYPKWCWGGPNARIIGNPESRHELRFYGLHWGWLTFGKWKLVRVRREEAA